MQAHPLEDSLQNTPQTLEEQVDSLNSLFKKEVLFILKLCEQWWEVEEDLANELYLAAENQGLFFIDEDEIYYDIDVKMIIQNFLGDIIAKNGSVAGHNAWSILNRLKPGMIDIYDIINDMVGSKYDTRKNQREKGNQIKFEF